MDAMDYFVKATSLLMSVAIIAGGTLLIIRGRITRRYTKKYEMIYVGALVRVQGLCLLVLGITLGFAVFGLLSEGVALLLIFVTAISGGITAYFLQRNGPAVKR